MGLQGLRSASGVRTGSEEMKNHADTNSSNTMLRSARRRALLSSTGLVGAMLLTALVTSAATPALADGGSGGNGSMGGWNWVHRRKRR
jgi:hypothetical protein